MQKVLQLYASRVLSKRSYARKGIVAGALVYSSFPPITFAQLYGWICILILSCCLWVGNEVVKAEQFLETLIQGILSSLSTPT